MLVPYALLRNAHSLYLYALGHMSASATPDERYKAAKDTWLAHRPDGATFDDDSPAATVAINAMWDAVIDQAAQFFEANPDAVPKQVETVIANLDPMTDPRFGPPLTATVVSLSPGLLAISVTDYTASVVFILQSKAGTSKVWRIDHSGRQTKDTKDILKAWRSTNASDACRDRQPKNTYGKCGPLSGSIGVLPPEASGAPRFYVDADYSKDMGALVEKQTSVWRWNGDHAELLWIKLYSFSLDDDGGVHYRDGVLSIIEKRFPRTFSSCNSCFEPTTEVQLRITPSSVEDLGESARIPELDLIDELFWRIGHRLPTSSIASSQVAATLQEPILKITTAAKHNDPLPYYVGMLMDWSVKHKNKSDSTVCVQAIDGLDPLEFNLSRNARDGAYITSVKQLVGASNCQH